jgi:hypothetical protein
MAKYIGATSQSLCCSLNRLTSSNFYKFFRLPSRRFCRPLWPSSEAFPGFPSPNFENTTGSIELQRRDSLLDIPFVCLQLNLVPSKTSGDAHCGTTLDPPTLPAALVACKCVRRVVVQPVNVLETRALYGDFRRGLNQGL